MAFPVFGISRRCLTGSKLTLFGLCLGKHGGRPAPFLPARSPASFGCPRQSRNIGMACAYPNPSRIMFLDLTFIRETHLSRLLSMTRGLIALQWGLYYSPDFCHSSNTLSADIGYVMAVLAYVRNTLKEFIISAGCDTGWGIEYPLLDVRKSFKQLAYFSQLERPEIPLPFLAARFTPRCRNLAGRCGPRAYRVLDHNRRLESARAE